MKINIKEIQNLLYVCNVNDYEMFMETDHENITVEINESIDDINMDRIVETLEEIFYEVDFEDYGTYISLWLSYHNEWDE